MSILQIYKLRKTKLVVKVEQTVILVETELAFTKVLRVIVIRTKQELDHTITKGYKAIKAYNIIYVKLKELKTSINNDLKNVLKAKI
jgi:hypothetical protein